MKTLLLFATLHEATHTLQSHCLHPVSEHLWRGESLDLLITGVGAYDSISHLQSHLQNHTYARAINLGCAADLQGRSAHECYAITRCSKIMEQPKPIDHARSFFDRLFPSLEIAPLPHLSPATLGSVDCPLHSHSLQKQWRAQIDLVDMEGYALAWVAKRMALPFHSVKCISDFGDGCNPKTIANSLSATSEALATWLQSVSFG